MIEGAAATLARCRPMLYVENDQKERSVELLGHLLRLGYRLWWHLPRLFSPANFRGRKDNVFGITLNANVLALPEGRDSEVVRDLRPITSPQDWWRDPPPPPPTAP